MFADYVTRKIAQSLSRRSRSTSSDEFLGPKVLEWWPMRLSSGDVQAAQNRGIWSSFETAYDPQWTSINIHNFRLCAFDI